MKFKLVLILMILQIYGCEPTKPVFKIEASNVTSEMNNQDTLSFTRPVISYESYSDSKYSSILIHSDGTILEIRNGGVEQLNADIIEIARLKTLLLEIGKENDYFSSTNEKPLCEDTNCTQSTISILDSDGEVIYISVTDNSDLAKTIKFGEMAYQIERFVRHKTDLE